MTPRTEPPYFDLNTLQGRKEAWAWLEKTFGKSPLHVTNDGIPCEDQLEALSQFKEAAMKLRAAQSLEERAINVLINPEEMAKRIIEGDRDTIREIAVEQIANWVKEDIRVVFGATYDTDCLKKEIRDAIKDL